MGHTRSSHKLLLPSTVLGPDNLLVTGDFPNFAVEQLEKSIGAGGFAMFVNGTQGNISMGHSSELSANRSDYAGPHLLNARPSWAICWQMQLWRRCRYCHQ
jgi:hypothetical protein